MGIDTVIKLHEQEVEAMRVIGGELRGKKLTAPKDDSVRPTTDRVKESMFNLISGFIDGDTVVYDLFSGTGSLGIEALSRGAAKAFFCDKSRESYNITKENITNCRLNDRSKLVFGNYRKAVSEFEQKADLVFLDPPYGLDLWKDCSDMLVCQDKLNEEAVIVMEHGVENELTGIHENLSLIKEKKYGAIVISIYCYSAQSEEI